MNKYKQCLLVLGVYTSSFGQHTAINPVNCKISNQEKELVEIMAQYQIDFYKRAFDFEPTIVNIDLIGKHKEYLALSHNTKAKYKTAGFYQSTTNKAYVDKTRTSYVKTIYHEIQHALIHQVVPNVPAWLNEGMSELFECFEVSRDGITPSIQGYKFLKMKDYIKQDKLNLRAFLALNLGEWQAINGTEEGYSYTVSYSFVCFLFMKYPNSVEMILQKIKQGKNSVHAIEYATKKDFTEIEREFKKQMG